LRRSFEGEERGEEGRGEIKMMKEKMRKKKKKTG
jgi:hypothetical protein